MAGCDTPIIANDASFERVVVRSLLPTVAVFWSSQERSQAQINSVLAQMAGRYAVEALFVKLEAVDAPQAQARHTVDTLPQFLFFREGKLIARAKGTPSAEALRPWVEYLLGRGPRPAPQQSRQKQPPTEDSHPVTVTDADFERVVLQARVPVLVDFWAAWCGPCRTVAPTVEALAQEFAERALVAKLDVDANPLTAQRFGVSSIPTLVFFQNGREVSRLIGAQPADAIRQTLAGLL